MVSELLSKLYADPKYGLQGRAKFIQKVRKDYRDISTKEINEFLDKQELRQINKKATFKGFYKIVDVPRSFQMDVFFMHTYKSKNRNISAFQIFIDILSKKMFVYPLKGQSQDQLLENIKKFHKQVPDLNSLSSDDQFNSSKIIQWCEQNKIALSTDVSNDDHMAKGNRLGIVDVATKTIKRLIKNYILAARTQTYIEKLPDLVENYNSSVHSSLNGKTPDEAYDDMDYQWLRYKRLTDYNLKLSDEVDFEVGDYVRRTRDRKVFKKEETNFLPEIYIISDVQGTKYELMDENGDIMPRTYKYFELMKVDPHEIENNVMKDTVIREQEALHKKTKKLANKDELNVPYETATRMVTQAAHARTRETRATATKTRTGKTRRRDVLY